MHRKIILAMIAGLLVFSGCRKDQSIVADCERLQNGISASNKEEVKAVIGKFIRNLPSQSYSEQNLDNLAMAISQQCGITATVLCFDCIQTLPSQTEISISVTGPGGSFTKIVDISSNTGNEMIFHNLHD